jgi:DNA-binding NarL/FixJ family response regulator
MPAIPQPVPDVPPLCDPPWFSPRERQVFYLMLLGCSIAEIAEALSIRPATVRTHRAAIRAKILDPAHLPPGRPGPRRAAPRRAAHELPGADVPPPLAEWPDLSPRLRQVARLVACGLATKSIARRLSISVKTVEGHRGRLAARLGGSDAGPAGLTRLSIKAGWIQP